MSEHPIPPPGSPQDLAARALTRLVQQRAEQTAEAATMAIGAGVGNYSMIGARPSPESPFAAVVVVVSGKMTDGDIRRLMEFMQAFEQDVSVDLKGRSVDRWEVNLKPAEGDAP